MEESTSSSDSYHFSFSFMRILTAGIIAAILTNILMALQGNNAFLYFGALFVGDGADPKISYAVGTLAIAVLGIILAFVYALILAPFALNGLLKAIIFAIILTAVSYYVSPKIPSLVNMMGTSPAQTTENVTSRASSGTSLDTVKKEDTSNAIEPKNFSKLLGDKKTKMQRILIMSFSHYLIFSLMLVLLYRRRC